MWFSTGGDIYWPVLLHTKTGIVINVIILWEDDSLLLISSVNIIMYIIEIVTERQYIILIVVTKSQPHLQYLTEEIENIPPLLTVTNRLTYKWTRINWLLIIGSYCQLLTSRVLLKELLNQSGIVIRGTTLQNESRYCSRKKY